LRYIKAGDAAHPVTIVEIVQWSMYRAELTNLERAECIEEWRKITDKVRNGSAPRQHDDASYRKTAEALGVSQRVDIMSNLTAAITSWRTLSR
jgi:hypothetical protein